ncbi:PAS domain-containing protein [Nisaea sediminum]|uniref:PAS domain-containing protein n=1 Tax=Nisaea sediminum TaxID=2775867 RepID=UPI001865F2C0|nr:PAS domain-containing protein [Nisaea sediminum]
MEGDASAGRLEEIVPPIEDRIERLIAYWRSKKSAGGLPGRRDIDPTEIPDLLPHIGLIDVLEGGQAFRYRLLGTHLNNIFGEDFTGKDVGEIKLGDYGAFLLDLYRSVLTATSPVVSDSVFEFRDKNFLKVRRVLFPLAADGRTVDMILFINVFRSRYEEEVEPRKAGEPRGPMFDQTLISSGRELWRRHV